MALVRACNLPCYANVSFPAASKSPSMPMATTMIQTSDVTWKMADGWPAPGETLSVTLAKEIGLALDDPDIEKGLKKAFAASGAVTVEDLKSVPHIELKESILENGMKQTMMVQLRKFVFGDVGTFTGDFPSLTCRTNSSLSETSSGESMSSVKSSAAMYGVQSTMTEIIGGFQKWQSFHFPPALHALLTEALTLGKTDTTQVLHLLFMFGIVAFRTPYICRPAKTRFSVLLNAIHPSITVASWMESLTDGWNNRRQGRFANALVFIAPEVQDNAAFVDLQLKMSLRNSRGKVLAVSSVAEHADAVSFFSEGTSDFTWSSLAEQCNKPGQKLFHTGTLSQAEAEDSSLPQILEPKAKKTKTDQVRPTEPITHITRAACLLLRDSSADRVCKRRARQARQACPSCSGQSCPSSRWITSAFWTTHKMQPQRLTQPMRPRQLSTRSRLSRATRCTLLVAGCKLPPRFAELRVARDCRVSRMTRISRKSSPSRARRCTLLYATRYLHVTSSLPARYLLHVTCTLPARYLQGEQEKKGKSSSKKGKSGTKRTRQVASDSSEDDVDNRPLSQVVNQNDDDEDPQVKITSRAEAE